MARLHVIGARRTAALGWLLGAWALLVLACAPWPRARSWALRAGGAGRAVGAGRGARPRGARSPAPRSNTLMIALGCLALGALTDRLLPWPRAPLAPAVAAVVALTADALAGTQLLMRSLLGPDPALGARFYGIGNELKSGLAVLVLAGVAALLYPAPGGRESAASPGAGALASPGRGDDGGAGVVLAVVEGSARIGAGVGGVILVSAGFAVASVMLLPGALTRRRALIVLAAPLVALVAARRAGPRDGARRRALHRQHPRRPLGRRPARRDRPPLQSRLGRAAQPRDALSSPRLRCCARCSACAPTAPAVAGRRRPALGRPRSRAG